MWHACERGSAIRRVRYIRQGVNIGTSPNHTVES